MTSLPQPLASSSPSLARTDRVALRWVAVAAFVAVFGILQWGGGAYTASFDGKSDEAAHFMNAVVMRDYVLEWPPLPPPVDWLEQYYVHYPRISPGQWPPLFHLLEAAWFLLVPPSRASAMCFVGLLSVASIVLFFRLVRRIAPLPWALFAAALLVAAPEFQLAATTNMTEALNLLLGILFLDVLVTFTDAAARRGALGLTIYGAASVFVKGTGVTLFPAPFLALLLSGKWREMRFARWDRKAWLKAVGAAAVVVLLVAAGTLAFHAIANRDFTQILRWAGVTLHWRRPWNIRPALNIVGFGVTFAAMLAALGIFPRLAPAEAALRAHRAGAAALVFSTMGVAFFVRGMQENRHFLLLLPALLVLSLLVLMRLWKQTPAGIAITAAAVALLLVYFPRNEQKNADEARLDRLAGQLRLPARILISAANGTREGTWIPAIRILQNRHNSTLVVRSTKSIAEESFNGERYRLLTPTTAEVRAYLDRHGIDTVILDDYRRPDLPAFPRVLEPPPHHELVRRTVEAGAAAGEWSPCGSDGPVRAYCRVTPVPGPVEPIRIPFPGLGRTIVERPALPAQK